MTTKIEMQKEIDDLVHDIKKLSEINNELNKEISDVIDSIDAQKKIRNRDKLTYDENLNNLKSKFDQTRQAIETIAKVHYPAYYILPEVTDSFGNAVTELNTTDECPAEVLFLKHLYKLLC